MAHRAEPLPLRHLLLGTLSFGVCFAAWGLISAFAPAFRKDFGLSGTQTALLVAAPVLLGAIARIPMGMASDRFGARSVFAVLMLLVAIPVALVPNAENYATLLVTAFFLGLAGAAFPIGVDYVSRWSGPRSQGASLGIYGLGNAGQSAAVFLGPVVAASIGRDSVFRFAAVLLVAWGAAFAISARNAPSTKTPAGLGPMLRVMTREPLAWTLSAFYFLTFGGFVAFAVYLPTLLKDQFGLSPAQAVVSRRGLRDPGDRHASGGRVARRSDRRRACALGRVRRHRSVRADPLLAGDGALHGGRARLRGAPGSRL